MKNTNAKKKKVPIEEIEALAVRGMDVAPYFDHQRAKVMPPVDSIERVASKDVQRVNVDLSQDMLRELDSISMEDNVPRQSLIKTMLRAGIDRYFSNRRMRKA
jgi:hypothetical protein